MNGTTYVNIGFGETPPMRLRGNDASELGSRIQTIMEDSDFTPDKSFLYNAFKRGLIMELLTVPNSDFDVFEAAASNYRIKYVKLLEKGDIAYILTHSVAAARIEYLNRIRRVKAEPAPTSLSYTSQNVVEAITGNREPALFSEDVVNVLNDPSAISSWSAKQYGEFLYILSSLPRYSAKNTELIQEQRPGAKLVGSKTFWRSMGRELVQNPSAISIWMPVEGEYKKFKEHKVYDISDTNTVEAPIQEDVLIDKTEETQKAFQSISSIAPVPIRQSQECKEALYLPDEGTVEIPEWDGKAEQLSELIREVVHAQLHKDHGNDYDRSKMDFVAESTSFALATMLHAPNYIYRFDLNDKFSKPEKAKDFVHAAKVMKEGFPRKKNENQKTPPDMELI